MKTIFRFILLWGFSTSMMATEDPANCDASHGGLGNTSVGGIAWNFTKAHLGDTVSVIPSFGMFSGACSADGVTGSVYIATGVLTNFLINVHSYPTGAVTCPAGPQCTPGPYNVTIAAPLVGAGVTSPNGNVSGTASFVKAVENAVGNVNTIVGASLTDFHSATLSIVTPCIAVFESCGTNYGGGSSVEFTGYVTNCGDITLTNVTVVDDRTASLMNLDGTPLSQPFTLTNAQVVQFSGSFAPFTNETQNATNTLTVTGKDTTTIGGPNSSVTNSVTKVCFVASCRCPCQALSESFSLRRYAMR